MNIEEKIKDILTDWYKLERNPFLKYKTSESSEVILKDCSWRNRLKGIWFPNIHGTFGNLWRTFFWLFYIFSILWGLPFILNLLDLADCELSFLDISTLLVGTFIGLYWNFRNNYSDKWEYCASIYNKTLDLKISEEEKMNKLLKIVFLELTLAIDLLDLGIWNDKSFVNTLDSSLFLACKLSDKQSSFKVLEKKEARKLLGNLHLDLDKKFSFE